MTMTDTCKHCNDPVDQHFLDWLRSLQERHDLPLQRPAVCQVCFVLTLDRAFVAAGCEPILPQLWKVVRP